MNREYRLVENKALRNKMCTVRPFFGTVLLRMSSTMLIRFPMICFVLMNKLSVLIPEITLRLKSKLKKCKG